MKRFALLVICSLILVSFCVTGTVFAKDELENTDPEKYYIVLDIRNQIVHVYEKDENGEYTKVVRRMLVTTGSTTPDDPEDPEDIGTPTPTGVWKVGARERFGKFASFNNEYARYWTQIVEGIYFHSIMFSQRELDALKSGAFNGLGNKLSHGCVRMYIEDAKWIYYNIPEGTTVNSTDDLPATPELRRALKSDMSFSDYDAFQMIMYDNPPLPNDKAWVVAEEAPMRSGTGLSAGVIKRVPAGAEVELLQDSSTWIKVLYEDREGYMLRAHVTKEQGVMQSTDTATIVKLTSWMFEDKELENETYKVPTNTTVKVLESDEEAGVTKIDYMGSVGWIETRDLTEGWGLILE